MSDIAIKVENLSKAYQLGQIGTGTVSRDIERWWVTKVRGKEDPFLKIGQINDRTVKGDSDIVWSLKDINFEIKQGDAVGIIGRNGAGKSTLLKLLSRVTAPTSGNIKVKGRIASLLEVGTGFHPELSGRENIYLNGAILGMRKKEIDRKFDEIVDFSGVERYIDTPVKRYSSGMYVRLAFAVAAHLESEILIVDEVLAVGDAEFQKKCLGKMGDVSKGEGKTVLFVSHNLQAVSNLCNFGLILSNGQNLFQGNINSCINEYSKYLQVKNSNITRHEDNTNQLKIKGIRIYRNNETIEFENGSSIQLGDELSIFLDIEFLRDMSNMTCAFEFFNILDESVAHLINEDCGLTFNKYYRDESVKILVKTKPILFVPGEYYLNFWIGIANRISVYSIKQLVHFDLGKGLLSKRQGNIPTHTKLYLDSEWTIV